MPFTSNEINERLLYACRYGVYNIAEFKILLVFMSDINAKDMADRCLLHWTAENNNLELTRILIESGANLNIKNTIGLTPLHLAVRFQSIEVIPYLLKSGANIEAQDSNGLTPLHWAVYFNDKVIAAILLSYDASMETKNNSEMTPVQLACHLGYHLLSMCMMRCQQLNDIRRQKQAPTSDSTSSSYLALLSSQTLNADRFQASDQVSEKFSSDLASPVKKLKSADPKIGLFEFTLPTTVSEKSLQQNSLA